MMRERNECYLYYKRITTFQQNMDMLLMSYLLYYSAQRFYYQSKLYFRWGIFFQSGHFFPGLLQNWSDLLFQIVKYCQ